MESLIKTIKPFLNDDKQESIAERPVEPVVKLTRVPLLEALVSGENAEHLQLDGESSREKTGDKDSTEVEQPPGPSRIVTRSRSASTKSDAVIADKEALTSNSDSSATMVTVSSGKSSSKLWKRPSRPRDRQSSSSGSASEVEHPSSESTTATKRGRGRPPTTGEYIGYGKARRDYMKAKQEQSLQETEKAVHHLTAKTRSGNVPITPVVALNPDDETAAALSKLVTDNIAVVERVAKASKGLKGTLQRALRESATAIREAVEALSKRTISDECRRLQIANESQQTEIRELRKELADMRAEIRRGPSLAVAEEISAPVKERGGQSQDDLMNRIGLLIETKLKAFEARLQHKSTETAVAVTERASFAAVAAKPTQSGKRKQQPATEVTAAVVTERPQPTPGPSKSGTERRVKGRGKGKKNSVPPPPEIPPAVPVDIATQPLPVSGNGEWTKVTRRPRNRQEQRAHTPKSLQVVGEKPKAKKKLRLPRTAAVVLTLLPKGVENELSYGKVIADAQAKIDTAALGIPPIKMKAAANGARILEVPGEGKVQNADTLAKKISELFPPDEVLVTRPTISTDLRVSGLDDSVTPGILAAAIAKAGDCPLESVKTGEIKPGPSGMGSAFVRCPVTAARKIQAAKRLTVGWVAVQVKLLDPRPRRCYRCLMTGHIKAQCKSSEDRSNLCHRCCEPGHLAKNCSAVPHCIQCATAGKQADHLSGGKACAKPPSKREARKLNVPKPKAGTQEASPTEESAVVQESPHQ
ncbi:unnamed protein product [Diatraea saccharalis]|uniref:CCHC-type domain-containing protein n=1 Tax=Diatraea saccharalis TaxID=40085 RepID=A0A9N9QUD5_9NEOP|nr:unnamed protein product [Diatraea saccharalis]